MGLLKCLKKDPEKKKKSFWIELYFTRGPRKGRFAGYHEVHKVPIGHIEAHIKLVADRIHAKAPWDFGLYMERLELALDYLFAELGRRANRKVLE